MIPRRLMYLFDTVAMLAAALVAEGLMRLLQPAFDKSDLLQSTWLQHLRLPPRVVWSYAASDSYLWLLIGLIPTVLVCLNLTGNYTSLLRQTRARIVLGSLAAPIAGLSLISLALFLCKVHSLSRFALGALQ